MLLGVFCVLIILMVGYAHFREGIFTAFVMSFSVLLAGLIAFNFWEPLADWTEPFLAGTFLGGFEDAFWLVLIFCGVLGLMRLATNALAPTEMIFPGTLYRGGGLFFGLVTGYLVAGFISCVLQTLPWHENFMYFDPKYDPVAPGARVRSILPPDRVWLGLMYRAGGYALANQEDPNPLTSNSTPTPCDRYLTFDKYGTFEYRYARYRRYADNRDALPYAGDLDQELGK